MCEIAAYLAQLSCEGLEVAHSCKAMAASWASQLKEETEKLGKPQAGDSTDTSELRLILQTKQAVAHCCAIICFGDMSMRLESETSTRLVPGMSKEDASFLCLHRSQAYQKTHIDSSDTMMRRLSIVTDQCSHVMACQLHALRAALKADSSSLDTAVRSVFADLPQRVSWQEINGHPGCYTTHAAGQAYAINVVNGCVLCNGMAPGHLPRAVVDHPEYRRLFGDATFEAAQLQGEQQGMFRTVQSHGGYMYTFQLRREHLYVAECPVDSDTGVMLFDFELCLLPCAHSAGGLTYECTQCPTCKATILWGPH